MLVNGVESVLKNYAEITEITNTTGNVISDSTPNNNKDADYIKLIPTKVSLQKIVYSVNGNTESGRPTAAADSYWGPKNVETNYWEVSNPNSSTRTKKRLEQKKYNPITVAKNNEVTYAIRVQNNWSTPVYITKIKDTLPNGVTYKENSLKIYKGNGTSGNFTIGTTNYANNAKISKSNNTLTITINRDRDENLKLSNQNFTSSQQSDYLIIYITVNVNEPNISVNVLRNHAEITQITDPNGFVLFDMTPNDNEDSDYIQLKDITISGKVWNDVKVNKDNSAYNGLYDSSESKLSGINVKLYRHSGSTDSLVATKITNSSGAYSFSANDLTTTGKAKHIKGPVASNTSTLTKTCWAGTYYSYYIVFEYDGIKYTTTPDGKTYVPINKDLPAPNNKNNNCGIDSNARERLNDNSYYGDKEDSGCSDVKTRKSLNNDFSIINKGKGLTYTTKNEEGYMPQSIYDENGASMKIQASTNLIKLENNSNLEQNLKYVDLGLRGRDTFDLRLSTDVNSIKVTVNGQNVTYPYKGEGVTITKSDISNDIVPDAANIAKEERTQQYVNEDTTPQSIRQTDISTEKTRNRSTVTNYSNTGLGIQVTYKITVTNESSTVGTANQIIDYYDSNYYKFDRAYYIDGNKEKNLTASDGDSGTGFGSKIITTQKTMLNESGKMTIYVVYNMVEPSKKLKELVDDTKKEVVTYHMSEIYEYATQQYSDTDTKKKDKEYTRGLIDVNSAPGSANEEQVRTIDTINKATATTGGSPTTVQYYFNKQNLNRIKFEDDTYTVVLKFKSIDGVRTMNGVVFEDKTNINDETRIKTGNGIKDNDEVGVYGATVELVEISNPGNPNEIADNAGTVRYRTTTDKDGNYTFSDYIPGNYVVRYRYGDTEKTILLHQNGDVNEKSYNGEDFQSTNNIGAYGARTLNKTANYWYVYNEKEGVSTGTDNNNRRDKVTENVANFTDEQMTILNNARDGKDISQEDRNTLISNTKMFATTPGFTISVEKTENINNKLTQRTNFNEYVINNMNFGISEVPVTKIDLQKHVKGFTITDSAGDNIIASLEKQENGEWKKVGDVEVIPERKGRGFFHVSIEDEKLQGARLEVTYDISIEMQTEKNYTNESLAVPKIEGIIDFVDNDLLYNEDLGENSKYWEVVTFDDVLKKFAESKYVTGTEPKGTVDPEGTNHSAFLFATKDNPILLKETGSSSCPIVLEKVLSAPETSLMDIITSSIDTYEYDNNIEISKINYGDVTYYSNGTIKFRDRVRTPNRYIILAGVQHDNAASEVIEITPPTGDNSIGINYYIIAVVSLIVLTGGIIFIKKYAIKKN